MSFVQSLSQLQCPTFNRKPNKSDMTPEIKDNTTTRVILYNNGLVARPDILYGLSKSYTKRNSFSLIGPEAVTWWLDSAVTLP